MSTTKGGKKKWMRRTNWLLKHPDLVEVFQKFPHLWVLAEKGNISPETLRLIWKMEKYGKSMQPTAALEVDV